MAVCPVLPRGQIGPVPIPLDGHHLFSRTLAPFPAVGSVAAADLLAPPGHPIADALRPVQLGHRSADHLDLFRGSQLPGSFQWEPHRLLRLGCGLILHCPAGGRFVLRGWCALCPQGHGPPLHRHGAGEQLEHGGGDVGTSRHHHRRRSIVLRRGSPDGGLAGAGIAVQSVGQVHDLILIFDAGPVLFRQPGHSPSQGLGHLPQWEHHLSVLLVGRGGRLAQVQANSVQRHPAGRGRCLARPGGRSLPALHSPDGYAQQGGAHRAGQQPIPFHSRVSFPGIQSVPSMCIDDPTRDFVPSRTVYFFVPAPPY